VQFGPARPEYDGPLVHMQAIGSSVPSSNALMLREAVCTLFGFGRGALLLRAMHRRLVRIGLGFSLLFAASANAQIPPLRSAYPPSQTPPPGSPLIGRDLRKVRIGALIWAAGYLPALVAPLVLWPRVESGEGPSALANYSLLVPVVGPLVSAIAAPAQTDDGNGRAVMSSWSVPWLLTSGLLQATGLAILISGARPHLLLDDSLVLFPTTNGVMAAGRF
jgi:hypothetical protein